MANTVRSRNVTVALDDGLHMRPLSQIAQLARVFDCDVRIIKDGQAVNAKEVFDLMTLNAGRGTSLVIETSGDGADDALAQLVELFESNFEEETSSDQAR